MEVCLNLMNLLLNWFDVEHLLRSMVYGIVLLPKPTIPTAWFLNLSPGCEALHVHLGIVDRTVSNCI